MGEFYLVSKFSETGTLNYEIDVSGDNSQDTSFITLDPDSRLLLISSTNPL
jgi:hypothetical protein